MKKRPEHGPAVLGVFLAAGLFFCPSGILRSAQKTVPTEAPMQTHINSHADWWQNQYGPSAAAWTKRFGADYRNGNSGPACAVMVINYKKRARISTDLGSFSNPGFPKIHTDARWKFCRANAGKGYPGGFAEDDQTEASGRELADVLGNEDVPVLLQAGMTEATLDRIAAAVRRCSLVICRVDPASYFGDEKHGGGRWVVVYGCDDAAVFVNDPGRPEGRTKKIARRDFLQALRNADRGADPVLLECVVMVGNYPDGWHADTRSRMFVAYYKRAAPEIGFPFDDGGTFAVHASGLCIVQNFLEPSADPSTAKQSSSILCLNQDMGRIFWVKGAFYEKFFSIEGYNKLGPPTSEEVPIPGGRRQDFEKGNLTWNGKTVSVKITIGG